jgi:hypothetical protein
MQPGSGWPGRANMGDSAGNLGSHSRSGTQASRHTVALKAHPEPKEIVMNPIQHIRRIACVLAGLAAATVAFATTPAFAMEVPAGGGGGPAVVPQHLAPAVHIVVAGGMPGWQITLIAVGSALLAATFAVLLDRVRATRRNAITAAA